MAKYFVAKVEEKKMANKKLWLGMLVTVLAFGLVMTGCEQDDEDDGGGSGPLALSAFEGTYNGSFTPTGTSLTVGNDSLKAGGTTISSVTTSVGGSITGGGSWVYLEAGGKKIGIATLQTGLKAIYLGKSVISNAQTSFEPLGITAKSDDITDGSITGVGTKS
jgi:hypothetical protein